MNKRDPQLKDVHTGRMPDGWVVQCNLNPLVNDASLAKDGDGLRSLQEYQRGTDPNDSGSYARAEMPWLPLLLGD